MISGPGGSARSTHDRAGPRSEGRQVAPDLPGADLGVILAPLVAFQAEELVGDRAEAVTDDGVGLEVVEGLAQGLGQDPEVAPGRGGPAQLVEVSQVRLARVE